VARESWEKLLSWGLVTPVGSGNGTADGQMSRHGLVWQQLPTPRQMSLPTSEAERILRMRRGKNRDVARESWEKLLSWGLVTPVGSGNGTADGQMFRVECYVCRRKKRNTVRHARNISKLLTGLFAPPLAQSHLAF
jgi:hypothetical protein